MQLNNTSLLSFGHIQVPTFRMRIESVKISGRRFLNCSLQCYYVYFSRVQVAITL